MPYDSVTSHDNQLRAVEGQTHELRLRFGELALIYKSLKMVKTLGALPPQDERLDNTIQLVDEALNRAV